MKKLLSGFLFFIGLCILACTGTQTKGGNAEQLDATTTVPSSPKATVDTIPTPQQSGTVTDARDGETYATTTIGKQTWMAENLRYDIPGALVSLAYPSAIYGRLYKGAVLIAACPDGWHLPTDEEWSEMEIALGMPAVDAASVGWRGAHGAKLKSLTGWEDEGNGNNSSGFNAFPAGFYFLDEFDGLGQSVGFWTAVEGNKAWVRFIGAPLEGVNRFEEDFSAQGALACRCVKD